MNSLSVLRHLKVDPRFGLGDIAKVNISEIPNRVNEIFADDLRFSQDETDL